jgi:uncharacterized protein (TIGR00156 family)
MKKAVIALFFIFAFVISLSAGYNGPKVEDVVVNVQKAKSLSDDAHVALVGYLVKEIKKEHYLFKDNSGEIEVEIDNRVFGTLNVNQNTKVKLVGEVDKDLTKTKIDVDYIQIAK